MRVLHTLATHFSLIKLHLTVQLKQSAEFPSFKGSMLHGWFGQVVKNHDGRLYHVLFGEHENQQPKPYIICPTGDHKQAWRKGELFSFELCLFGEATRFAEPIVDAIMSAATNPYLGLGDKKVTFEFVSLASLTPKGLRPNIIVTTLADWLDVLPQSNLAEQEVALCFDTPVRIKYQDRICDRIIPRLDFWCAQILRRLIGLSRYWVIDDKVMFDTLYIEAHQSVANNYQTVEHCYWEDWQRFSKSKQSYMPFGGIKGQISFYGELYQLIPLLKVGELLHLGGKTTFGLGKYRLIV